jgi:hypothetical protein
MPETTVTTKSFQSLFENTLKPQLVLLERQRKMIANGKYAIYAMLPLAIIEFLILKNNINAAIMFLAIPILAGVSISAYLKPKQDQYLADFKRNIIWPLIQLVSPDLEYDPNDGITKYQFITTGIYDGMIDDYRSEDMIRGVIGETNISFCEVLATRHAGRHAETIFSGIIVIADFNKNFNGKTIIRPTAANLGQFGKWVTEIGHENAIVHLENVEFEKKFEVYGSDQVEARYIITPLLMEKLLQIEKEFNTPITVSFVQSFICIGIPHDGDLFEPRLLKSVTDTDYLEEYYHYLMLVTGLVNELNLNTRIWTKE